MTTTSESRIAELDRQIAELEGKTLAPVITQRTSWEYKSVRFDYLGRGITQEFNILDIDGKRVEGWWFSDTNIKTLPDLLQLLGAAGWELVSHHVNQDNQTNNTTLHYMNFKRPGSSAADHLADDTLTASRQAKTQGTKLFVIP